MRKIFFGLKHIALYYVSATLILFAFSKFFNVQFQKINFVEYIPLKELTNRQLAWAFFGRSYNYNLFLGIVEFIAGSLLLFNRTRLAGLLIALGVYTNIILVDFLFGVNDAIQHATIEFIIVLIWLIPYLNDLVKYLWSVGGKSVNSEANKNKRLCIYLPFVFIVLISGYSLYRFRSRFDAPPKIVGAYKISEMYVDEKKLELGQGKYTKDPMLFFEFKIGFSLSANDSIYFGSYEVKADSIFVSFDKEFKNIKSLKGVVNYTDKTLKGITNNNQSFEIGIKKLANETNQLGGIFSGN